jgi:hypothetical protein
MHTLSSQMGATAHNSHLTDTCYSRKRMGCSFYTHLQKNDQTSLIGYSWRPLRGRQDHAAADIRYMACHWAKQQQLDSFLYDHH